MERSRISGYFDNDMNWIGPAHSPEAMRRAEQLYREGLRRHQPAGDRVEFGDNKHHATYTRIKVDEALYSVGLLQRGELHRDADTADTFDLVRVARDFLSLAGAEMPPGDQRATVIQRALGSSDFPSMLNAIMNKALALGYQTANVTWPLFTVMRPVKDYKTFEALRGASMQIPAKVPENAELGFGPLLDEGSETGAIESYKQRISISRQALANGDIEQITMTPYAAGQSISRLINKLVFEALTSNPTLSDGVACFHSDHGNYVTSGAAPSVTTLDTAASMMGAQVNAANEPLNIRPNVILGPHDYSSTFSILRNSINSPDPAEQSTGKILTATDSALTGTGWYAVADPAVHPGIAVVVLAGTENTPRLEELTKPPIGAPDGRHWLLGYDCAAVIVDHKALFQNDGA